MAYTIGDRALLTCALFAGKIDQMSISVNFNNRSVDGQGDQGQTDTTGTLRTYSGSVSGIVTDSETINNTMLSIPYYQDSSVATLTYNDGDHAYSGDVALSNIQMTCPTRRGEVATFSADWESKPGFIVVDAEGSEVSSSSSSISSSSS